MEPQRENIKREIQNIIPVIDRLNNKKIFRN